MKTAKEILHDKANKYQDGFLSGQVKWIVEAMEEYAKQDFSKEDYEAGYDKGYGDGHKDAVNEAREEIRQNYHANTDEWSV